MSEKTQSSDSDSDSVSSVLIDETTECRVCHKGVTKEEIKCKLVINPCNCQGVYAWAHKICINERLERTEEKFCAVCRFTYQMTTKPKSWKYFFKDYPFYGELGELIPRTIHNLNIFVISYVAVYFSQFQVKWWWSYPLWAIGLARWIVILQLWAVLLWKSGKVFLGWQSKHYHVFIEQNKTYKRKETHKRKKSPSRVSGSFSPSKKSSSKTSSTSSTSK